MTRRRTYVAIFAALALLCAGTVSARETRLLRDLSSEASLIVIGRIEKTQDFADGALSVHKLALMRTLKGQAPRELQILEQRRSSLRLYHEGQRVLVFLDKAPSHSFFREHLPPGSYLSAVGGKDGVIELEPYADKDAQTLIAAYSQGVPTQADEQALVRRELRSGQSRFVADAVSQLALQEKLAESLTAEDFKALSVCLADSRVEEKTKAKLVRLLGQREVEAAEPLLRTFKPSSGAALVARAQALADLGSPPGADEIERYLRSSDPEVRSFGLKQLATSRDKKVVDRLESVALHDDDKEIRIAAIEALGATGRPQAAQVLERTFDSEDVDVRRASARGFHELGGAPAQQALADLVFDGRGYDVQAHALVLMFAMGATREDPAIERIRRSHPDKRIRRLIDEGIVPRAPSDPHGR